MFITWLLGVGRFCLAVKYGRYSLKGADWHVDTGSGLRATASPLDQAEFEALRVSEALRRRLNRRVPVSPALALFDMEGDRRIERLARRSGVPLLWNLERYTGRLADTARDTRLGRSLEKSQAPGGDIRTDGKLPFRERRIIPLRSPAFPSRIRVLGGATRPENLPQTIATESLRGDVV